MKDQEAKENRTKKMFNGLGGYVVKELNHPQTGNYEPKDVKLSEVLN